MKLSEMLRKDCYNLVDTWKLHKQSKVRFVMILAQETQVCPELYTVLLCIY